MSPARREGRYYMFAAGPPDDAGLEVQASCGALSPWEPDSDEPEGGCSVCQADAPSVAVTPRPRTTPTN